MELSNSLPTYQVLLNLEQVYFLVDSTFEAALSQFGLSSAQWSVLRLLRQQPGASGAEIARLANVSPQAVATMLQRLEKAALIERQEATTGRVVQTYLTSQGELMLQKGDAVAEQIQSQVLSGLTLDEQKQFNQALLRCVKTLQTSTHSSHVYDL